MKKFVLTCVVSVIFVGGFNLPALSQVPATKEFITQLEKDGIKYNVVKDEPEPFVMPLITLIGTEETVPKNEIAILGLKIDKLPANVDMKTAWTIWQDNKIKTRVFNQNNQVGFGGGSGADALVTVSVSFLYKDGDVFKHEVTKVDGVVKFEGGPNPTPIIPTPGPIVPKPVDPVIPGPTPVVPTPQFPASKFNSAKTLYDALAKVNQPEVDKRKAAQALGNLFKGQAGLLAGVPSTVGVSDLRSDLTSSQIQAIGALVASNATTTLTGAGTTMEQWADWYTVYKSTTATLVVNKTIKTGDDFIAYWNEVASALLAF